MEPLRKDMDRLYDAVERLRRHTDSGFAEIRASLEALRRETSANLEARRRETCANIRWMIGLTVINTTMILGMGGRLFGLY